MRHLVAALLLGCVALLHAVAAVAASPAWQPAGVEEGDLIAVGEGGMQAIAIRFADTCTVNPVVSGATRAHGEGRLVFTMSSQAPPSPSPSAAGTTAPAVSPARSRGPQSPASVIAIIVVLVALGAGALVVLRGRLEPPGSGSAPRSR